MEKRSFGLPKELLCLSKWLKKENIDLFLVGGAVRDRLLGYENADYDVASCALPDKLGEILKGKAKVIPVNPRLGTVHVSVGDYVFEHTTFRKESYGDGGSHDPKEVTVGTTMKEDAFRRDFSVNALYLDINSETVLDPTGRGLTDIEEKRLRTTTEDPAVIMRDDGLRLLRLARLTAELGFSVDGVLLETARKNADLLRDIPKERIAQELNRLLLADAGAKKETGSVKKGLDVLLSSGIAPILFPELMKDGGEKFFRNAKTAEKVCPELETRLAALLMETENIKERLLGLGFPKKTAGIAEETEMSYFEVPVERTAFRVFLQKAGYETMGRCADIAAAREETEKALWIRKEVRFAQDDRVPISVKDLKVTGDDISAAVGREKGIWIGQVLDRLLKICAQNPNCNEKEKLLDIIRKECE